MKIQYSGFLKFLFSMSCLATLLSACSGGGGADNNSGMNVSLSTLRTTGVAPLAVMFDATGTTDAGVTSRPFHDLEYRWDFGDAAGGKTWATGSQVGTASCSAPYNGCRNHATGAVVAHVYETPGTYTATLTVYDGKTTSTKTTTITVSDAGALVTACVANGVMPAAGDADGCPATASKFYNSGSFNAGLTSAIADGAQRILFRKGDTFTSTASYAINTAGPGIIGAYGTGNAPYISMATIGQYSAILSVNKPDWRIMDLTFDGTGTTDQNVLYAGYSQLTLLRITATHFNYIVSGSNADQLAVVDSNFSAGATSSSGSNYGVWCGICTNVMLLGNSMYLNTTGSHNIRLQGANKFVISNSTQTGGNLIEPFTIRGNTQYGVLSDNKLVDNIVTVKPQNSTQNEYQHDIIFERNWFVAGNNSGPSLDIQGSAITIRNNIFDLSLAPGSAINTAYANTVGAPKPTLVNIYNNTIYNSTANNGNLFAFQAIRYLSSLDANCQAEVKNNLAYSPNTYNAAPVLISNEGPCVITGAAGTAGNSADAQIKTSPMFANTTLAIPADYIIGTGSYAHNSGVVSPVYSDYFGNARSVSGSYDSGAILAQ